MKEERDLDQEPPDKDLLLIGGTTLLVFGLLGFVGNVLVLVITRRILRYRKNLPTVLILLLAWIDTLCFPLVYPQSLIKYFSGVYVGNSWACEYQASAIIFLFGSSIFLVASMSIDRLLALYKPFCYGQYVNYNPRKVAVVATSVGLAILTVSVLPALGVGRNVPHFPGTFCLLEWNPKTPGGKALFYVFASFLALAVLLVVVCNLVVVLLVWRMTRRALPTPTSHVQDDVQTGSAEQKGSVELQFAKLSCAVALTFAACWSLFLLRVVMRHAGYPHHQAADLTAVRLASLHPVLSPWIYPLVRRKYRKGFYYLLRLAAHYVTCTLVGKPQTTLDEIVEAQSRASQVRELYQEERRRSSAQRLVHGN